MASTVQKKKAKSPKKTLKINKAQDADKNTAIVPNIIDYSPTNFVSRNLKLIPTNMYKVIEYLLYTKPTILRPHETKSELSGSSSFLLRSSTMKSIITLSDAKKKMENWHMNVENADRIIKADLSRGTKKSDVQPASSLFRMRTDPWPESKVKTDTFSVTIMETPTISLFFFRKRAAIEGTEEGRIVLEENEGYSNKLKAYKKMYNAEAQTPAVLHSNRWMSMYKNPRSDRRIQISYSDIYDTFNPQETITDPDGIDDNESFPKDKHKKERPFKATYTSEDLTIPDNYEFTEACKMVDIVDSAEFFQSYVMLIRCLDRNINWKKQVIFKKGNVTDPLASKCEFKYTINHLWTFRYIKVWGMPVTSLCINPVNSNIIAVGHGMYFMDQPQHLGRVCIWNFKNCSIPEKHIEMRDGVTSLSFSIKHPFALLVSLISGKVMILDISKMTPEVIGFCGGESSNNPVWQARWFTFDSGQEEPVACGENGIVYLLSKDSFTRRIFVTLTRREGNVKGIAMPKRCRKPISVSDKPSVFCLATNPDSHFFYLVGTDDGCVHICSTDYWHEHTDVFQAHYGPVHIIKFHPDFCKIFLTVGIDNCVRIWASTIFQPLVTLLDNDSAVEDADWSPVNPNIVATVASDRVSIWDISRMKMNPHNSLNSPTGARFTTITFTSNGSNLICGDNCGDVHIYSLSDMPFEYINKLLVLKRTFQRILLGKSDLHDKLRTLGYPFDNDEDLQTEK